MEPEKNVISIVSLESYSSRFYGFYKLRLADISAGTGSLQNVQGHRVKRVTPDHAQTLILTLNLTLNLIHNPKPYY